MSPGRSARVSGTRVLWLIKGLGRGGAEQLVTLVVPKLANSGFDVEVAYLLPAKDALVDDLRSAGVRVHCLAAGRRVDPLWVWRLRRLVRARRFQLVHTHSPVPAVAARLLLGPRPPALVHTEHNVWRRYHRATYLANALSYSRNAAVIAVSQAVARSVKAPRILPRLRLPPVETVLHGIDGAAAPNGPAARAHGRSLLGLHDADPVLGTVGNFTPKKDHAGLFDAFARVLARFPAARLVLVGSGPLERELRQRVHRDGLDGHVTFTGIRDDVAQLLPAFDVFVLSSRHEGLSLALLEAMAAGVPCVATRVGGVPEALGDGRAGVLVPFGDSSALAEELARLLDAPELRRSLGAAGRSHALAAFGIERAVRRTGEIYAAVLASR